MTLLARLIATVWLVVTTQAVPTLEARQDTSQPYLNLNITAKGKLWFGTAIDTFRPELSDTKYMTIFNDSCIFGGATPANTQKWKYTEPTQNHFTLSQGQQTINVAKATNKKVRCHNLVWSTELPDWVINGNWTNATMMAVMENHITNLIKGYGQSCYSWDVVNEALKDDGTFGENPFHYHIGEAYVPLAFKYANAAVQAIGGGVKLYYNEYGAETPGVKQRAMVDLVKRIQAWPGAHIDGVGLESHFSTTSFPDTPDVLTTMSSLTTLGVDVAITELDVACSAVPCSAHDLAFQAKAYYNTIIACMKTPRCIGVTVWDFVDKYSSIQPSANHPAGNPDLYFSDYTRHPAYTAAAQAIFGWDCSVC